jgi:hypothetical protein
VLLVAFGGYLLFSSLNTKATSPNVSTENKKLIIKSAEILPPPPSREKVEEISMKDIMAVEEVPEIVEQKPTNEKEQMFELSIEQQLEQRMEFVYEECKRINTKKGIIKKLKTKKYKDVFLANFSGDTLYGKNDVEDLNARTIVLEQIQKVRKHGKAFLISDVSYDGEKRYMLVKNLELDNLYLGVEIYSNRF